MRAMLEDHSGDTKTFRLVSHNFGLRLSPLMSFVHSVHGTKPLARASIVILEERKVRNFGDPPA